MAGWLEQEYLPGAPTADGVGADRYRRHARSFLGHRSRPRRDLPLGLGPPDGDPGRDGRRWPSEIRPGAGLDEVVAALASDPDDPRRVARGVPHADARAGAVRHGGARGHPLRHPRADPHHRRAARPEGRRARRLLHPAVGGLQPARHHVVVARRQGAGADLGRGHDRLPRGLPRPSPPVRPAGVPGRPAQPGPPPPVLALRLRRGLGALRRAAHARARLPRPARSSSSGCCPPTRCGPCGS